MNIHIFVKYINKHKSRDQSLVSVTRRNKETSTCEELEQVADRKFSWHSDKRKYMSFLSHPEGKCSDEGVSQAFLTLTAFSQAQGWGPWWGNPLSDRKWKEEKRKTRSQRKEDANGKKGSNLYPLKFLPNYKVPIVKVAGGKKACKII